MLLSVKVVNRWIWQDDAILHHSENKSCGKSRIYYNNEDSVANFL